jgi:hypothetical protein
MQYQLKDNYKCRMLWHLGYLKYYARSLLPVFFTQDMLTIEK